MSMLLGEAMAIEGGIPFKTSCMRTGNHVKESLESWTRQNIGEKTGGITSSGVKMPLLSTLSDVRNITGCKYVNLVNAGY